MEENLLTVNNKQNDLQLIFIKVLIHVKWTITKINKYSQIPTVRPKEFLKCYAQLHLVKLHQWNPLSSQKSKEKKINVTLTSFNVGLSACT